MAKVRVEAEVVDTEQAAQKFGQIDNAVGKLNQRQREGKVTADQVRRSTERLRREQEKLKRATRAAAEATKSMKQRAQQLSAGQAEAATKAVLLGQQIGVTLPTAMQRLVTRTEGLQKLIGATFSVSAVVFFAQALLPLVKRLNELRLAAQGFGKEVRAAFEDAITASREAFLRFDNLATGQARLLQLNQSINAVLKEQKELLEFRANPSRFPDRQPEELHISAKRLKEIDKILVALDKQRITLLKALATLGKQRIDVERKAEEEAAKFRQAANDKAVEQQRAAAEKLLDVTRQLERERFLLTASAEDQIILKKTETFEKIEEIASKTKDSDELVARARVAVEANAQAQIEQLREKELMGALANIQKADVARKKAAEAQAASARKGFELIAERAREAAEKNREAFEQMAGDIESFLDRVFLTARSFSDVWRQLMGQIVSSFAKSVSRMVAEWFTGMRQMQTGAALGGQGIIGGLLGPLFGTAGGGGGATALATSGALATTSAGVASSNLALGGGVISTPSFNPALGNPALGVAITGTVTGIPNAQGGATQSAGGAAAFGGIGGLLKNPAFLRLAIGGGAVGAGLGLLLAGGPVKGAIGGLLGTFGALVLANVLLTGVAAAATLGLSVAGGILVGSFLRGRSKRKATRIEEDFVRQGLNVVDQFKKFQIAFGPTISSLEQIKLQGEQALLTAGLGRAGRRGAGNLVSSIDAQIQGVTSIQRQREARLVDIQNLTLPEFAVGGPVRGINSARGGILALLHPGEFVMRSQAVQSVGESFLAGLNRLPQFQSGGPVSSSGGGGVSRPVTVNFNIRAADGASVARMLNANKRQIQRIIRRAVQDRAL